MEEKDRGFRQERKPAFSPEAEAPSEGVVLTGNVPEALKREMNKTAPQEGGMNQKRTKQMSEQMAAPSKYSQFTDPVLEAALNKLRAKSGIFHELTLPSQGKFYTENEAPANGVLQMRPMTGAEEQILATPKFVKKGLAINKIFEQCVSEDIDADKLLTVDRTYMLIYLRGISFTPNYDVDIQCPSCSARFQTTIDLNALVVEDCPDDFDSNSMSGVLPTSGLTFRYRLSTGKDEQAVTEYREKRIKDFGDAAVDDTMLFRASLLLEEVEGVTSRQAIQMLISRMPINDVAFLRNVVNDPPFGVKTKLEMICPSCTCEFEIDMPLESNFFFPRRNKEEEKRMKTESIQQ
jgi:hypothetical protein